MKKILMLLLVLLGLFLVPRVKAQEFKLRKIDQEGIYFVRTGGTVPNKNGTFAIYYLGDSLAYCIDPSKSIRTEDYVTSDGYVNLPYSNEVLEKLELYGYYGREYPGHDNVRYSMAAQALIWEAAGVENVTFWTGKNGTGEVIDVSSEKNEIKSLVEKHRILPNLPREVIGDVKHEIIVEDTNKALNNFEAINNNYYSAYIDNNKLHITPMKTGAFYVNLQRKKYDNLDTLIFVGKDNTDTQTLGRLRFSDLSKQKILVLTSGVNIYIQKVDENNEPVKIANIKFKIKNIRTNKYLCQGNNCEYETDSNGIVKISDAQYDNYEIEEVENQVVKGYLLNNENKTVSINENTVNWSSDKRTYIDTTFKNNSISATLEINKKGEEALFNDNEISYQENNLGNIYFDLFDENNCFIKTIITDNNGYAKVDNLKIGKYYLEEKTNIDGYIPNTDRIRFEILNDNSYENHVNYQLTVNNYLKKGTLEFSKVDSKTNVGISNTIMEIYNENNELLLTKETNQDGKIIVNNLPAGKYYLKEKEANYYYQKSNEIINFEIKENNEIVKESMTNEKIMGELLVTKYGESFEIKNNKVNYKMTTLKDIEFGLYDDSNNLIETLKTDSNGIIRKELAIGKYYLKELTKLDNYKENSEKYYFEIKKNGEEATSVKLNINNYLKKGGVEFSKEELLTKFGISDTIMEIYNENDELLLTKTTNENGKIIVNNLPLGKYYLKEKEANYFFRIVDTKVPFEITKDGEIIKTNLTNEKIVGNLEVYKQGENYHFVNDKIVYELVKLHGIEFDIYSEDNTFIGSIETDSNGYAKYLNLPLGKYYLKEKTNLDNYIHDSNKYPFEIKKNGNNAVDAKLEIKNYLKKGTLKFSKVDNITNEGITNTIVEIYNDSGLLMTKTTDENGKIIVNNLPVGKYSLKEKEANYYYQKTDETLHFEIKNNEEVVELKMTNKKIVGKLELFKKGEDYKYVNNDIVYEKTELANIMFDLYDSNDILIKTLKTNDDGYAKCDELPLGKYYLKEKSIPNNYISNDEKHFFEIQKNGNEALSVQLEIVNYLKKGNLEFNKVDLTTNEGIPNTVIEIYNNNNKLLLTRETDEFGKVSILNLPIGKYYIIEKEANSMYQITNEKVFFEIKENNELVNAKMTNEKITIPVPKTNTKEDVIAHSIVGLCLFIGVGGLLYERKKTA